MSKSTWLWVGLLVVVVLLFWWWHRHRRKVIVAPKPGIGTPLQSPAAAPPPTSIFSKLTGDASAIFGDVSSIFSGKSAGAQGGS